MTETIQQRKKFSLERLELLRKRINEIDFMSNFEDELCIYVTGSFARNEASEYSDLDLFFLCNDKLPKNLDTILLKAELIKIIRELGFPDFSGDGEFLTIHSLEDIKEHLGSAEDDYKNIFTARLLLLLESVPIYNESLYNILVSQIVSIYYKDYHDHIEDFKPVFLANDIIRFWKTLCLNYEHKRNRRGVISMAKNKSHLKNFKLKFSRLMTCYAILCATETSNNTPDKLKDLIKHSPLDRLLSIRTKENEEQINRLVEMYSWFLEQTGREEEIVLDWIANDENRKEAFKKADMFHDTFYEVLHISCPNILKYYTI